MARTEMIAMSKRKRIDTTASRMKAEQATFRSHWQDLANYIRPTRPRFTVSDANRGTRKNQKIFDTTPTMAARTLSAGMMSGVTSPARPWVRLTTFDPDLAEFGPVREWLKMVTDRMVSVFIRSNLYQVLPIVYSDAGVFGTAATYIEEDFESVVRFYSIPVGSYYLGTDEKGTVNRFYREFKMTVGQLIDKFGRDPNNPKSIDRSRFSSTVLKHFDNNETEIWIDVAHWIGPNPMSDSSKAEAKFKKWESVYYEVGGDNNNLANDSAREGKFLRESGVDFFPVLGFRWETTGEDVYATDCPGMTALGDIRALMIMHKRKAQAIEKMVNPSLQGPASLRNTHVSLLAGDVTYFNDVGGGQGLRPIHEVNLRVAELTEEIREHQSRISRAFFEDLFLMIAQTTRRQITAREIEERHEEKLLALGPVLERINQDLLDPLIDITFELMLRQQLIPPPPPELEGQELKVEYISIMAQAQKLIALGGIERFTDYAVALAANSGRPDALDKVDLDQLIDEYADGAGISPRIVIDDEAVAEVREARAQQQAAMQQAEQMQQMTQSAKNLAQSDISGENALSAVLGGGAPEVA